MQPAQATRDALDRLACVHVGVCPHRRGSPGVGEFTAVRLMEPGVIMCGRPPDAGAGVFGDSFGAFGGSSASGGRCPLDLALCP
jgi:hypothetical protein